MSDEPEVLLARALETLSSAQRQRVTAWLLARTTQQGVLGRPQRDQLAQQLTPATRLRELYGQPRFGSSLNLGEGHHVVPVRLPNDLHASLRDWSGEHGFSMATVVRGLVARFLETQQPQGQTTGDSPDAAQPIDV